MADGTHSGEITLLLMAAADGDKKAENRVFELMYDELRRLARYQLVRHGNRRVLDTTELIHDAELSNYLEGLEAVRTESRHGPGSL